MARFIRFLSSHVQVMFHLSKRYEMANFTTKYNSIINELNISCRERHFIAREKAMFFIQNIGFGAWKTPINKDFFAFFDVFKSFNLKLTNRFLDCKGWCYQNDLLFHQSSQNMTTFCQGIPKNSSSWVCRELFLLSTWFCSKARVEIPANFGHMFFAFSFHLNSP